MGDVLMSIQMILAGEDGQITIRHSILRETEAGEREQLTNIWRTAA
jgi:hypothetical protein